MDEYEQIGNENAVVSRPSGLGARAFSYALKNYPETTMRHVKAAADPNPLALERQYIQDFHDVISGVGEDMWNTKADMASTAGGAATGARLMGRFGVIPGIAGATGGAIIGSLPGKEVDQNIFKTQPQRNLLQNLGQSTLEAGMGLGLEGLMGGGKMLARGARDMGGDFLSNLARRHGAAEIPYDKAGADVILGAEQRLTGQNRLPVYMYDQNLEVSPVVQENLDSMASVIKRKGYVNPREQAPFLKGMQQVKDDTMNAISSKASPLKQDEALQNEIKTSISTGFKKGQQNYQKLTKEIQDKAGAVKVPFEKEKIRKELLNKIDEAPRFDDTEREALREEVNRRIDKIAVDTDSITQKQSVSGNKLIDFRQGIENVMPQFAQSKNSQGKVAGLVSNELLPVLDNYNNKFLGPELGDLAKKLSTQKKAFSATNSPLGRKLGLDERLQMSKNMSPEQMQKAIFDTSETFDNFLELTKDNPNLRNKIIDAYKADIYQNVQQKGFKGIDSEFANKDPEFLKSVFGDKEYQKLLDARTVLERFSKDDIGKTEIEKALAKVSGDSNFDPTALAGSNYLKAQAVKEGLGVMWRGAKNAFVNEGNLVNNLTGVKGLQKFENSAINDLAKRLERVGTSAVTQAASKPVMAQTSPNNEPSRDPYLDLYE